MKQIRRTTRGFTLIEIVAVLALAALLASAVAVSGRGLLRSATLDEAIAQVGAVAVLTDERYAAKLPLFGGLDGARFRRQVGPGDTLRLEVEMSRLSARAGKGEGRALVDGDDAVSCALMFVIVDAD